MVFETWRMHVVSPSGAYRANEPSFWCEGLARDVSYANGPVPTHRCKKNPCGKTAYLRYMAASTLPCANAVGVLLSNLENGVGVAFVEPPTYAVALGSKKEIGPKVTRMRGAVSFHYCRSFDISHVCAGPQGAILPQGPITNTRPWSRLGGSESPKSSQDRPSSLPNKGGGSPPKKTNNSALPKPGVAKRIHSPLNPQGEAGTPIKCRAPQEPAVRVQGLPQGSFASGNRTHG